MTGEWVIDVTMDRTVNDPEIFNTRVFCFCPHDPKTGDILIGMSLITDWPEKGRVIGLAHFDGQEAVEQWIKDHPDDMHIIDERMAKQ